MNEEAIRTRIHRLLEEIHTEADPVLLNRCRSIFRREVSFFHRSYMAAYLLLLAEEGPGAKFRSRGAAGKDERSPGRGGRKGIDTSKERSAETPRFLGEEDSVRLFISIGRSRKVFPREILSLIGAKTQVSRNDIGAIRILDNYSFCQVRTAQADAIIQALNGQVFRGKTLTVNYARNRREEDEDSEAGLTGPSGETVPDSAQP
ncbi:MAG: DbpA RNA binding domain-containing protein [Spirochaetaceae bacterium]|jgi:hypothetical protein|nr:DbpA RNA binding domain-containing protein [Spirochaetaceae bacterium]